MIPGWAQPRSIGFIQYKLLLVGVEIQQAFYTQTHPPQTFAIKQKILFSRESDSTFTNVRLLVCQFFTKTQASSIQ